MNDFDYDCAQKKRIARGDKNRVRSKRGCSLPMDYMKKKDLKKLNGEVKTMKLNEPMTYKEYKHLPEDLKKMYLKNLIEKYKARDYMIAELFEVHPHTVLRERSKFGLPSLGSKRVTFEEMKAWEDFIHGKTDEPVEADEPAEAETPIIEEPTEKQEKISVNFCYTLEIKNASTWDEVMSVLRNYPLPSGAMIKVELSNEHL